MSTSTIQQEHAGFRVSVHRNGRAAASVEVWDTSCQPTQRIWMDTGRLATAKYRDGIVEKVAEERRLELMDLLMATAAQVERPAPEVPSDDGDEANHPFPNPEPWDEPIDGAELLDDVAAAIYRWVWLPNDVQYDAAALWGLTTHVFDAFDHTPRLLISSAERGSGKSTLLDVLAGIVGHSWLTTVPSDASLFRSTHAFHPCLLIDEGDHIRWRDREGLVTILNAGFKQSGAVVPRCVGESANLKVELFDVFVPIAVACIGLPPVDTIVSRSIVIDMQRAAGGEVPARPFRDLEAAPVLHDLKRRAVRWANDYRDALKGANPTMPVTGRAADVWYPLVAVADRIGGEWPARARAACRALSGTSTPTAPAEELLGAIRVEFRRTGSDWLSSEDLVTALNAIEGSRWSEWRIAGGGQGLSTHKLAKTLKRFHIKSSQHRDGAANKRGYPASVFEDAFRRYLEPCST